MFPTVPIMLTILGSTKFRLFDAKLVAHRAQALVPRVDE